MTTSTSADKEHPKGATRAERRKLLRAATKAAKAAARNAFDYTPDGKLTRVTNPRAIARLEKAYLTFVEIMVQLGEPVPFIVPLDEDDAKAFPRYDPKENPPGSRSWLAVSLDVEGRFTHVMQHIVPPGRGETEDNAFAATVLLETLEDRAAHPGFPITEPEGTC